MISLPNDSSIRAHEAAGFRRAGVIRQVGLKHGRWLDVSFWQRPLNESRVSPVESRAFTDVGMVRG